MLQKIVDEWLKQSGYTEYVEWAKPVKGGEGPPEGTTHCWTVNAIGGRPFILALKVKAPYNQQATALIVMLTSL